MERRLTRIQEHHIRNVHQDVIEKLKRASLHMQRVVQDVESGKNVRTAKGEPSKLPEAEAPEELFRLLNESEQAAIRHIQQITRLRAAISKATRNR